MFKFQYIPVWDYVYMWLMSQTINKNYQYKYLIWFDLILLLSIMFDYLAHNLCNQSVWDKQFAHPIFLPHIFFLTKINWCCHQH